MNDFPTPGRSALPQHPTFSMEECSFPANKHSVTLSSFLRDVKNDYLGCARKETITQNAHLHLHFAVFFSFF